MNKYMMAAAAAGLACVIFMTGCSGVGPKKKQNTGAQGVDPTKLYEPDLSKPEGPMLQMLRSAQEKDLTLFKACFVPTVDLSAMDEKAFSKFRTKVLSASVSPVPESTVMVSDTEATVKLRTGRGNEIPMKVQLYEGRWLLSEFKFGRKGKNKQPA